MRSYLDDIARTALVRRISGTFRDGEPMDDGSFNDLALEVFAFQYERNPAYRRLCAARGSVPGRVGDWKELPLVPTDAFKSLRIACFGSRDEIGCFETSGTTQGKPGRHYFASHGLYDGGAMPWFERHLLPGPPAQLEWISLAGPPGEMPRSSLVHMISTAARTFAGSHGGSTIDSYYRNGTLDVAELNRRVICAVEAGRPVLVLATAFALVHWLDALESAGERFDLPQGSRVMETGGYKGRSRELSKGELYDRTARFLGIPRRAIINEYGMTEMSSQFYDRTLCDPGLPEAEARLKRPPPWVRSVVLDPVTLRPVPDEGIGVLAHIDLANLDTCAFIMTGDAARMHPGGFELLGRFADAVPRGCSLDYEDFA